MDILTRTSRALWLIRPFFVDLGCNCLLVMGSTVSDSPDRVWSPGVNRPTNGSLKASPIRACERTAQVSDGTLSNLIGVCKASMPIEDEDLSLSRVQLISSESAQRN